eukprot:15442144-Alexandrium_andersonii.AAC.1
MVYIHAGTHARVHRKRVGPPGTGREGGHAARAQVHTQAEAHTHPHKQLPHASAALAMAASAKAGLT